MKIKYLNPDHERDTAVFNIIGERDFNRYLRLRDPDIPSEEFTTLMWKISGNQIVRLRREARQEIRNMNDMYSKKSGLEKRLRAEKAKAIRIESEIERLESFVRSQNEIIKYTHRILASLGKLVIAILEVYVLVATDHDFAQLINVNAQEVAMYRVDHERRGKSDDSFFVNLILAYKVESEPEQPLFKAMLQMFQYELDGNEEFRRMIKDKAYEFFPGVRDARVEQSKIPHGHGSEGM